MAAGRGTGTGRGRRNALGRRAVVAVAGELRFVWTMLISGRPQRKHKTSLEDRYPARRDSLEGHFSVVNVAESRRFVFLRLGKQAELFHLCPARYQNPAS
jgi:hypothetical protein